MSQTYPSISATDLLSDSRQKIIDRDEAVRTWFLGATEPVVMEAGQPWIDTANSLIKVRNETNTDWYVLGDLATELGHLPLTGGTLSGYLTLHADPNAAMKAATKQYVDTMLPKAGGTMAGYITLHADPDAAMKAATKQYVDTAISDFSKRENFVATGTQTVFVLTTFTYTPGVTTLLVFSGGILMVVGAGNDYIETNSTTITFNTGREAGEKISIIKV